MKNLLLLTLIIPLSANAVEMWEGDTTQLDCDPPTAYTSGEAIEADDIITFTLYRDGLPDRKAVPVCQFLVSPPVGNYIYKATAVSAKYGSESLPTNDLEAMVKVKKQSNSPTNFRAKVLPPQ